MNKTYNRPSYIDPSTITDGGRYYHAAEVDETIAALRQRIAELEEALKEARQVVGFAIGTFDGYQQTASEFAAVTKMQEWQERTRAEEKTK